MKVICKNGKIYLQADFQKLTDAERNYMRELSYKGVMWGKFDEDGDAPLYERESLTPYSLSCLYECIDTISVFNSVEVDESAKEVFKAQKEKAEAWICEEYEAQKHLDELKRDVQKAYDVRRYGCGFCSHKRLRKGKYICTYADKPCYKKADEAELEFYANREARALGLDNWYWAAPYPVPGCEVIIKGRQAEIELQELEEKEKEGGNNGKI